MIAKPAPRRRQREPDLARVVLRRERRQQGCGTGVITPEARLGQNQLQPGVVGKQPVRAIEPA